MSDLSQEDIRQLQHELLDCVHDEDAQKVRALCRMALSVRKLERELKIQDEANDILTRKLKETELKLEEWWALASKITGVPWGGCGWTMNAR